MYPALIPPFVLIIKSFKIVFNFSILTEGIEIAKPIIFIKGFCKTTLISLLGQI